MPKIRTLNPAPLLEFVKHSNEVQIAERLNISRNGLWGYRKGRRIHYLLADRYAIRLGVHPMIIWGDEWLTVIGDGDKKLLN
jgi:hypothetical protein